MDAYEKSDGKRAGLSGSPSSHRFYQYKIDCTYRTQQDLERLCSTAIPIDDLPFQLEKNVNNASDIHLDIQSLCSIKYLT